MLNHPLAPALRCLLLGILLCMCVWNKAACSPGAGRTIWQQPRPDPIQDKAFLQDVFPSGFLWGSGTSAFQTEGAWDQEGKGPSIWDQFTHSSEAASVASDSYNHWEEDVEALELLGVRTYSFSLSWPRLFPDGKASGQINRAAVEHYSRLIEKLLEKGIEPIVTLHHWDLPQVLQEQHGGWRNDTLVGLFEEYATFCFRLFGSRVKYWLTMHNPYLMAVQGYGTGVHAPGEMGGPSASLVVAHNLIRAHAKAWHTYNTHFRPSQKGQISIVLGSHWAEPLRGQATDKNIELCQQSVEAVLGWFANPIFGEGDYPASLRTKHGLLLPTFTPEETLWVQKTADFFALSFGPNNLRLGRSLTLDGQTVSPDLRRMLSWIKLEYGDLRVLVAEGGWFSEAGVGREDTVAIYLMKSFVNQVLKAIRVDGVQVFGYVAWSLVDGFEWNYGYTVRRGLFYMDFSQPNRTRTPKTSALYYQRVVANNGWLSDESSREVKGRFPCDFHWGIADSTLQVQFTPFSPQFTDPHVYSWNLTGDGSLRPVPGLKLSLRSPQCTDYLGIRDHLRLFESTGASHYRFALNWSLILPHGDLSYVNSEALRYYRCVLSELKTLNLEAAVILYHPTNRAPNLGLPESIHATGGWLNRSTVDAFQTYASLCYQQLGPLVRYWITVNEPNRLVDIYSDGTERHRAAHNLLLAHAKAWRSYKSRNDKGPRGLVSLALHADWAEPANPFLDSHVEAAQRFLLFELGRFLDPLLGTVHDEGASEAEYPREMKAYLKERARVMGLPGSPLPTFNDTEKEELKGALDFITLNHFTTRLVSPYPRTQTGFQEKKQPPDHDCLILSDPTWTSSGRGQALVPWGLRRVLNWVNLRYGGVVPIVVTASGVDDQEAVEDKVRQLYLRSYLQEALKARQLDGINLHGFYLWKLQDRHVPQFGLFTSSQHQSKAKASVAVYREIISHGGFPDNGAPVACRSSAVHQLCAVRAWMKENRALLLFSGCLLVTLIMLGVLIVYIIVKKRTQVGAGRSRMNRTNSRRRRRDGLPVCPCLPVVKSHV